MKLRAPKSGIPYILISTVLWAMFPVVTAVSFKTLPILTIAAIATFFSMLFFGAVLLFRPERRKPSRQCIRDIAVACLLIGIGYYTLSYVGISLTTPGNAAILFLMEIFFSYLFISVIGGKEPFIKEHVFGAVLMVIGILFVLLPSADGIRVGDFIILFATMLPPIGNLAMQRARKEVSSHYIMFWRAIVGTVFLSAAAVSFEDIPSVETVKSALPLLLLVGILILGFSKILWIEAIHRLPITQTISIDSIRPLFTLVFAYLILGQAPEWVQILSIPFVAAGMFLLTKKPATL